MNRFVVCGLVLTLLVVAACSVQLSDSPAASRPSSPPDASQPSSTLDASQPSSTLDASQPSSPPDASQPSSPPDASQPSSPPDASRPAAVDIPAHEPPATEKLKSGTIRFSQLGTMDVKDVPWLMALDVLREMGYTVELTAFAKSSLIPPALLHGDIDVGSANTTLVWAAIEKGADIRTVAGRANVGFYLVATQEIRDCRDLDKKVITFSTRQSIGYVMFEKYLNRHCPGVTPEVLMIDGSENRVVALQVREVVAAYVEIEEWYQLQQAAPGEFHVLIDFGREFPQVQMLTFTVRREWADENSEMLKDFIRALLEAKRHVIEDPQFLQDMIAKYQSLDADKAKDLAEVYLEAVIWDPNGGITQENIQYTLDFLIQGEILSSGLGVEEVADLSYLNAVLDDIGRQR